MFNDMLFMTKPQFLTAISGMSPSPYFAVSAASNRTTQYVAESMSYYLQTRRGHGAMPGVTETAFCPGLGVRDAEPAHIVQVSGGDHSDSDLALANVTAQPGYGRYGFVDPLGIFYGEKSTDDRPGFQANSAGTRFGVDQQLSEHIIAGIGGAYVNSQLTFNDHLGNGRIDTFMVGPYATYYGERYHVDAITSVGFNNNDMHRNVLTGPLTGRENTSYSATDAAVYLGAGQDIPLDCYTLSPIVSLQYIYYRGNEFTESGVAASALTVLPQDANSLRSRLGVHLSRNVVVGQWLLTPEAFGGWAHEFLANDPLDARFALGVASFATDPGGIFRDAGYFGCGAALSHGPRATIFARYEGELSGGGVFNGCNLGLSIGF
jgi:uncharacterized protein YhjY with autotransporter beta-barrel domain